MMKFTKGQRKVSGVLLAIFLNIFSFVSMLNLAHAEDGPVFGVTSPGGQTTQVQYNCGNVFCGDSGFTTNGAGVEAISNSLTIGGTLTAGSVTVGGGGAIQWGGRAVIASQSGTELCLNACSNGSPGAMTLSLATSGSGSNVAPSNATLQGPLSTGTATDGDIIIQTGVKNGSSGSGAATPTTALTIKGETQQVQLASSMTIVGGVIAKGSAPTLTGTCTTASQTGGNTAGTFTASCTAGTVIITFATTAPNGWNCNAHDQTTPTDALNQTSSSASSCTLTGTTAALDTISFNAMAF